MKKTPNGDSDEIGFFSAVGFWEFTIGTIFSGISFFSLIVRSFDIGVYGLAALIHDKYEWVREQLFKPLAFLLPTLALSSTQKNLILFALILATVSIRANAQIVRVMSRTQPKRFPGLGLARTIPYLVLLWALVAVATILGFALGAPELFDVLSLTATALLLIGITSILIEASRLGARYTDASDSLEERIEGARQRGAKPEQLTEAEDDARDFGIVGRLQKDAGRLLATAYAANVIACLFWSTTLLILNAAS